jgi:hypothetical protein
MCHFIATSSSTSFLLPCKQKLLTASTVAVAVVVVAAVVGESTVEESEHKLDKNLFEFHTEEHCNKS